MPSLVNPYWWTHIVAYMLHPSYKGVNLTVKQLDTTNEWIINFHHITDKLWVWLWGTSITFSIYHFHWCYHQAFTSFLVEGSQILWSANFLSRISCQAPIMPSFISINWVNIFQFENIHTKVFNEMCLKLLSKDT